MRLPPAASTTAPATPAAPAALAVHPQGAAALEALRAGRLAGARQLDLRGAGLAELPAEVLSLADTLESLDISGNALVQLPDGLSRLTRLHTLFASGNRFEALPPVLGRLPALDTVGFRGNRITEVPGQALPARLRWLILTDNAIAALPDALCGCQRLQKLMLAGNRLRTLPAGIGALERLELLRLAANRFETAEAALPAALLALPRLAWLAFGGNPFTQAAEARLTAGDHAAAASGKQAATGDVASACAPDIPWSALRLDHLLGEGASGHIHAARWQRPDGAEAPVALKLFKGALTSDGLPCSEMAAALAAGRHPCLVGVEGRLVGHPAGTPGLVLPLLPAGFAPLAGPPSMASCSRDVYDPARRFDAAEAAAIAGGVAAALAHLHAHGLLHGDLYAHNLLVDGRGGVRLGDFGAASPLGAVDMARGAALRALDQRAFAVLVDELAVRADDPAALAPWRGAPRP